MAGLTERERREVVIARFAERLWANPKLARDLNGLEEQFPQYMPLTPAVLAAGITFGLVMALAERARAAGLDRVSTPWALLARCLMLRHSSSHETRTPAAVETARRYTDWYFDHFVLGHTILAIASRSDYSEDTVKAGIRNVTKLLRRDPVLGRPMRHHFAS
jgi:hypothetical protein